MIVKNNFLNTVRV